jgi:hypothetical protein
MTLSVVFIFWKQPVSNNEYARNRGRVSEIDDGQVNVHTIPMSLIECMEPRKIGIVTIRCWQKKKDAI